jgi:predicted amidophosphoribosyltransferase
LSVSIRGGPLNAPSPPRTYGAKGKVRNLVPLCPKCRMELAPRSKALYEVVPETVLCCDRCGFTQEYHQDWQELKNVARKEVERKIRTGIVG